MTIDNVYLLCYCVGMEFFHISQPDKKKVNFSDLYERYINNRPEFDNFVKQISYPKYLPWEKARFIKPPTGFNIEEAWTLGRDLRTSNASTLPIETPNKDFFKWSRLPYMDKYLNDFALYMGGGQMLSGKVQLSTSEHQTYMTRGIIEESIASSQLEGASVTRKDAKNMIAENRLPRDKSEWMILNNYRMMTKTTDIYKDVPLSRELLLEMHQILAANTMDESDIGRWRRDTDNVTLGPELDPRTTYVPPKESFFLLQLDRLIAFANDEDDEHYLHPVIKAIVLHFWIGYLHPFADGNGRMARAIFYWYLLKKDYWLATYVPISTVIKRAPMQYSDAYVYAEQDHNDFTYFLDYHLQKMKTALQDFLGYIQKQDDENRAVDQLITSRARLNERQKQVMHYLLSDPHHRVSAKSHASLNNISSNTAQLDLKELQKHKLVYPLRSGKFIYYYARSIK